MIQLSAITKSFERPGEGVLEVLKDVDFTVGEGEFVAIVGPSGSGKSTLMNILGLLDRPDSGDYQLMGSPVSELSAEALAKTRNRTIGFVFQQFNLLPKTSALENVKLPLFYSRSTETGDPNKQAKACLERVGLADRMGHETTQLSGGQQQRVAIARALVNKPSVILADEPTGALDTRTSLEILDLFRELNESGITVIVVTHDREVADESRRSLFFRDGRVVDDTRMPG